MGLYSDAELIWGIPVLAWDEDGNPTQFWDEEADDWKRFDGDLEIISYGHYEDPDNQRGILSSTRLESYRADCWKPKKIPASLPDELIYDKVYSKANDAARSLGLDVDFYTYAGWWLVASFG